MFGNRDLSDADLLRVAAATALPPSPSYRHRRPPPWYTILLPSFLQQILAIQWTLLLPP